MDNNEDLKEIIPNLLELLRSLNRLGKSLQYIKNQKNNNNGISILMIGEVGSGKSTTNNHIIYNYSKMEQDIKYDPKNHKFKAEKSTESVTKEVLCKSLKNMKIIDSPGTNDPQKSLTDPQIAQLIQKCINDDIIYDQGLSCVSQCVLIDVGARIRDTAIRAMSRMLLTLTIIYPNFGNIKEAPRINVIFTNFSKTQNDIVESDGLPEDDDYNNNEEKKVNNGPTFETLIQTYRKLLTEQCYFDLAEKQNKDELAKKIEAILPDNNFYGFKIGNGADIKKETEEVIRLIKDNQNHGQWILNGEATFEAVQMEYEDRDALKNYIKDLMDTCKKQLENANQTYITCSGSEKGSEKIADSIKQMIDIQEAFNKMIQETPWSLLKTPPQITEFIRTMIQKFSLAAGMVATEEIGQYNKKLAQENADKMEKAEQKIKEFEKKLEIQNQQQKSQNNQFKEEFSKILQPSNYPTFKAWFGKDIQLALIYRATKNGFGGKDFHKYCDNKGPTLVVIRSQNGNIFGGYANSPWTSGEGWIPDAQCFLFSVTFNQKFPYNTSGDFKSNSMYCYKSYGPTFGYGYDLHICNNSNTEKDSYSKLGRTYDKLGIVNDLIGDNKLIQEIEVFTVVK